MPRLLAKERAAILIRIFSGGIRQFVDETLDGKRGVRMADRSPPQCRHSSGSLFPLDVEIRNVIRKIVGAFDRGVVDAVLEDESLERRAGDE